MSLRLVRPARLSAVAVVVAGDACPPSRRARTAGSSPPTRRGQPRRAGLQHHREARFAPVQPQSRGALHDAGVGKAQGPQGAVDSSAGRPGVHRQPARVARRAAGRSHRLPQRRGEPGSHRPRVPPAVDAARGDRPGGVRPRPLRRVGAQHGRRDPSEDHRCRAQRARSGGGHPRHRHGRLDGDDTWDRAVGPMQFIPSTWAWSGRDGDGDGVAQPARPRRRSAGLG